MSEQDPPSFNRRNFFRQGLAELFKPLSRMTAPLEEVIRQIGEMDADAPPPKKSAAAPPSSPAHAGNRITPKIIANPVRPPGALPEQQFRESCSRCGECVKVCPVHCIRIDESGLIGAGAPFIDVDSNPCVLCDGLLCMSACPTGALVPTPLGEIDMGTASWQPATCRRTNGEPCTICVDDCPVGEMAIIVDGGNIHVIEDGCTGCGVCQNHCPTTPRSIVVIPKTPGTPLPRSRGK